MQTMPDKSYTCIKGIAYIKELTLARNQKGRMKTNKLDQRMTKIMKYKRKIYTCLFKGSQDRACDSAPLNGQHLGTSRHSGAPWRGAEWTAPRAT